MKNNVVVSRKSAMFMQRSLISLVLILILAFAGCVAPPPSASTGGSDLGVRIQSANAASITLTNIFFSNDANNLRIADHHCNKYDRVAQFLSREQDLRRYNCIKL